MKKLIFICFLALFLVGCPAKKNVVRHPKTSENEEMVKGAPESVVLEKYESVASMEYVPDRIVLASEGGQGEGIGLGSLGTIGHGAGVHSSNNVSHTTSNNLTPQTITTSNSVEGKVIYVIPSEMKVRETYTVTVRIGKSSIQITENLGGETIRSASIPITETMEVKLIDPSPSDNKMFEIVADNNGVQMVDTNGTFTQWTWNVTPIKTGLTKLKIVVSVIRNGNKKETVYQDSVKIKSYPRNQIKYFIGKYWQWLFTTLLIPIFKYLWGLRKKKEDEKQD